MKYVLVLSVLFATVTFTDLDLRDGRDLPAHGADVTAAHDNQPSLSVAGAAVPQLEEMPELGANATTTTTTTVPTVNNAKCPQWHAMVIDAGLDVDHLARWDLIIWRESRCQPDVINFDDPNGGSYGLTQVNGFWCRPSRYHPDGWLQEQGIVNTCDDLLHPAVNLAAAQAIFQYSADRNRCGWLPWTTRNTRWCS